MKAAICIWLMAALAAGQTVINGDREMLGRWNAGEAASTRPAKAGALAARPANCSPGDQYFVLDAAAGQNLHFCTELNTWTPMSVGNSFYWNDLREVRVADEFCGAAVTSGQIGTLGWTLSGTSATTSYQVGAWPNLCIVRASTNSTANNISNVNLVQSIGLLGALFNNTDKAWELVQVFKWNQTTNSNIRVGLVTGSAGNTIIANGIGVRNGATNWEIVRGTSSAEDTTVIDLGEAVDTDWHTLRIYTDGATVKKLYIQWDGGTPLTVCGSGCDLNIPAANGFWAVAVSPMFFVQTTTTAVATMDIDYFGFRGTVGTSSSRRNQ